MKCSLIRWYTLTYARDKLGIGCIRFKHAVIRYHTLVIRRVRCSYTDIRWSYADIRWSYAGHTQSTLFVRRHRLAFVDIPGPKTLHIRYS